MVMVMVVPPVPVVMMPMLRRLCLVLLLVLLVGTACTGCGFLLGRAVHAICKLHLQVSVLRVHGIQLALQCCIVGL